MKKHVVWMGALLLAVVAGCKTEAEYPYAPYYYPNLNPPFSQNSQPARQKAADSSALRVASMSSNPAN